MKATSTLVARNGLHVAAGAVIATGLMVSAVLPGLSQDVRFGDPIETDYAPYTLGQAGEEIARSLDGLPQEADASTRTETVTFSVGGLVENYGQAEYKITMKPGDTVYYAWTASGDIHYEFHGHTMLDANTPGDAVLYRNETGSASAGVLTAPLEGWHGWYFVNDSFDTPVEIELTLAGDFEMTPGFLNSR
ncbi:MAG TPA: hypothetical protein VNS12_01610 [Pelagibacterium sp.]|uniref:hypothetical protein n=1 Tax=Pelagibacterium sp. TaxID=1967288 RepID=UPI002C0B15B7|nr:hypothetical protein [Pelagibacterium sp.]HWJ86753.1 hypothetical protein [Pelagibacterium sp.]